jgi:four helix bundle protein
MFSGMKDHRSLEAWKEAQAVSLSVIEAAREYWRPWASAVFAQLLRSSLSVQLNVAEGATFSRSPTYTRHLGIAYGSAVETGELLELAARSGILPPDVADRLVQRSSRCQRLLLGLLKLHRPMH